MSVSKRLYWVAQLIGWGFYAFLIFLASYLQDPEKIDGVLVVKLFSQILLAIFATHLLRAIYLHWNWLNLKLTALIPRLFVTSLFSSIFISYLTALISSIVDRKELENQTFLVFSSNVLAMFIVLIFWNALYFTFHFFQKSRKQELNNSHLEANRNELELKNLRSQLNPHFLFNSLNNIRALIDLEPAKAKIAVTTLSNLLRNSLVQGKQSLISLEEELTIVSDYLEMEKIRFEERLEIQLDINPNLLPIQIPPFILQTLVENAVKHGVSKKIEGGTILVSAQQTEELVEITVQNSGTISSESGTKIGIENIKRRLELQFKGNSTFELLEKDGFVVACIRLKNEKINL